MISASIPIAVLYHCILSPSVPLFFSLLCRFHNVPVKRKRIIRPALLSVLMQGLSFPAFKHSEIFKISIIALCIHIMAVYPEMSPCKSHTMLIRQDLRICFCCLVILLSVPGPGKHRRLSVLIRFDPQMDQLCPFRLLSE